MTDNQIKVWARNNGETIELGIAASYNEAIAWANDLISGGVAIVFEYADGTCEDI
jgi:hypothetical protein